MEFLQIYPPRRVPSNLDWVLNSGGTLIGALLAALLEKLVQSRAGALFGVSGWARARGGRAAGAVPFALLFPAAVPFGLGQVLERLDETFCRTGCSMARLRTGCRWATLR